MRECGKPGVVTEINDNFDRPVALPAGQDQ
jgi:hypothetical protein